MAGAPVLMVALVTLPLQDQSEALPPVQPGAAFWTDPDNVPALVAARGQRRCCICALYDFRPERTGAV